MANIFDLADAVTGISDALRANREGNAARRQESLKTALSLLEGAQSAAQTREVVQRTTQTAELFPTLKASKEEELTQSKQKSKQTGMDIDAREQDIETSKTVSRILQQRPELFPLLEQGQITLDVLAKLAPALETIEGALETAEGIRRGGPGKRAKAGIEVAELGPAVTRADIGAKEASAFRDYQEGKAAGASARAKATKQEELRAALKRSGKYSEQDINSIVAETALIDAGGLIGVPELDKEVTGLYELMAKIRQAPSVEAALANAEEAGDVGSQVSQAILQSMGSNPLQPLVEIKDKIAAENLVRDRLNQLYLNNADRFLVKKRRLLEPLLPPPKDGGKSKVNPKMRGELDKILEE